MGSINAWVRVYEDDALAAADRADAWLATGDAPALCGIPIGLKDLYAVAGKPLTASSRLLDEVPGRCARRGPVSRPLGWCCSATCTRTSSLRAGRPTRWAIPGPSTARPAARVAARQQRSQRAWSPPRRARTRPVLCASHRPSAAPRRSSRPAERCRPGGSCRSARPSTMPGRWRGASRTAHRCSLRWRREPATAASAGPAHRALPADRAGRPRRRRRRRLRHGPGRLSEPGRRWSMFRRRTSRSSSASTFLDLVCAEMLVYHRRFDDRRGLYRPSIRGFIDYGERRALSAENMSPRRVSEPRHLEVGRLVRRAPSRRADRADRADRRAASRARLRRGVHRRR